MSNEPHTGGRCRVCVVVCVFVFAQATVNGEKKKVTQKTKDREAQMWFCVWLKKKKMNEPDL